MPRRPAIVLFTFAFLAMAAALVWMVREIIGAPDRPAGQVLTEKGARKAGAAQRPAEVIVPGAADPNASAADKPNPADALEEALSGPNALPGEALLTFKTPEALAAFKARAAQNGLEIVSIDPALLTARVRYKDVAGLKKEIAEHGSDIAYAGPNLIARIPGLPAASQQPQTNTANAGGTVPFRSQGLDLIGAPANRAGWGKGATVAVIDSGVTNHAALKNASVTHIDLVDDGKEFNGHGTAMASLIAGDDASVGGVSPAANILDVRVADPQGNSNTALLASGIMRAIESGAQIINVSLGSAENSPVLQQAVQYALSRGVVIIAAAGNEQATALSYPAALNGVVSVGAVDAAGKQAWFSNSGSGLSLVAPGVGIVTAYTGNKLVIGSGTSQATAIVSGAAAYLYGRGYQTMNIRTVLTRTARPTGAPQIDVGAGILHLP